MRYVAAYCLASLSGSEPNAKTIKKIIESVGVEYEADKADKVVSELAGKSLEEVFAEGAGKLGSMPAGGAVVAGGSSGGGGGAAAPAEEKKEEKVEEEEESDDDMGFGLFD